MYTHIIYIYIQLCIYIYMYYSPCLVSKLPVDCWRIMANPIFGYLVCLRIGYPKILYPLVNVYITMEHHNF